MSTTIADVKRANKAAGQFWFSPDTMRFFAGRVESELIGGRYFVTSEKNGDAPRLYTVREAIDGGESIDTVGDFQQYRTKAQAMKAARALAAARAEVLAARAADLLDVLGELLSLGSLASVESPGPVLRRARDLHHELTHGVQVQGRYLLVGEALEAGEVERGDVLGARFRESSGSDLLGRVADVLLDRDGLGDEYDHDRIVEALEMSAGHFLDGYLLPALDGIAADLKGGFHAADLDGA